MPLFQCEYCGCVENTATSPWWMRNRVEIFDWTGIEERKGKALCSACAPAKYATGLITEYGKWHGVFRRHFLPLGLFRTASNGNLEHIETGDQDISKYESLDPPAHILFSEISS